MHVINCSGAILVTQWIDPYGSTSASSITQQLDEIAAVVAREILERRPDGAESCCLRDLTTSAAMERVRTLNLSRDVILETINAVLYTKLGFTPAGRREYYRIDSSLINKVNTSKGKTLNCLLHCTVHVCLV